ncbi:ZIP family metal transporter [Flagellimonas lutaonensis]|uniref:Zinc/iron permease n=1 Tax=Flagellimonas lutaonensis TaxID=516051 RepID=A0A0D5YUE8_9FLAO|nr:ZIP family metal transporter [Allomuricauda lutaonensis]AKA35962.1 zinc/iron permease [Allomuricauda lutaonensis]
MAIMTFLLPMLAVLLSMLFVFFFKPKNQNNIKLLLAFSGAFLLALSFFELLPEVYLEPHAKKIALFILAGILLQVLLESFSKGAEHGHMHMKLREDQFPIALFLSLSLHALVEGFPITEEGSIIYGILVHKVPVALILGIFLVNSKLKTFHIILFMLLFSLMTPLGSYLAMNADFIQHYGSEMNALAIGIFLHVSTVILFESAQGHTFNFQKMMVIVLGITIAYFL